jgi:hypothetical protein
VNTGLILKADNEAELAGVMAHEIAHVAARHGTRQATRGEIAQLGIDSADFHGRLDRLRYLSSRQRSGSDGLPEILARHGIRSRHAGPGIYVQGRLRSGPAFVDFFEKIQSQEKRKPGTVSKVFSTHPPTDDRIKAAQKNIQSLLKAKPEYVVTTSEFNEVKDRLLAMHNKRKIDDGKDSGKPQLRRAPGSGTGPVDADENGKTPRSDDDDRPTLKRRPSDQSDQTSQ